MKRKRGIPVILALICCAHMDASLDTGWVHYQGNPQRTAYTPGNGPDVPEVLWKVKISCYGRNMWTGETTYGPGAFDTSPFIIGGNVLALWKNDPSHISKTKVILIDLLTGEIFGKETVCAEGGYIFHDVFPVNNRIIGKSRSRLDEFDPASGKVELLAEIPEKGFGVDTYPILLKDKCVIHTTPPVCLSLSDFSALWSLDDMTKPDWIPMYVVGDEDIVIFIMNKGSFSDYSTQRLLAVDPSAGVLGWENDSVEGVNWLTLGKDAVYCGGYKLWAFNREGIEKWEFVPESTIRSNLVLGPDALYFADGANNIYKIDLNGDLVWKTSYEGSPVFRTHLAGVGDILYCIESFLDGVHEYNGSQITAYSMKDGSIIWRVERGTLDEVRGSPAISQGVLVVGTMGGELVAFASDPELFVKQGEAFISMGSREQAVSSYQKAVTLYEKKGNTKEAEKIEKRISELGISPTPTAPPSPPVSSEPSPSSPPATTGRMNILLVSIGGVILIASFICYLSRKKH